MSSEITCPLDSWPPPYFADGKIRFAGVTGRCHKGHSKCVTQFKRQQAEHRNGISLPKNRKVNRRRDKRPELAKAQPEPIVIPGCPWPWKQAHPTKQAAAAELRKRRNGDGGGGWKTAEVYRCPAEAHFHIGHIPNPGQKPKRDRERQEAA